MPLTVPLVLCLDAENGLCQDAEDGLFLVAKDGLDTEDGLLKLVYVLNHFY